MVRNWANRHSPPPTRYSYRQRHFDALETIAEFNQSVKPTDQPGNLNPETPPGQLAPDIIVLLTDGVYTMDPIR
jgi:hypothetical protein